MAARAGTAYLALVVFAAVALIVSASDADPVADFAITSGRNGGPVTGNDFAFRALSNVSIAAGAGAAARSTTVAAFPALATQGISFTFLNYAPCGQNAIHTHPRATELLYVIEGQLNVGFVDTNNTLFSTTIFAGDVFVFPRGLIHFQTNPDSKNGATAIAALNSQNPGAQRIGSALFLPSAFPTNVVQQAFNAQASAIEAIKMNFPANGNPVGTANTGCAGAGAAPPANGTAPVATGASPPANGTAPVATGASPPAANATAPAAGATPPATGATPPATKAPAPAAGATPPATGATPPATKAPAPATGATPPATGATPPATGATPPATRATPPATGATAPTSAPRGYRKLA